MGGCVSTANNSDNMSNVESYSRDRRRRLTISKNATSAFEATSSRGKVSKSVMEGSFLSLFPESEKQMSVGGLHAKGAQRGFENKMLDNHGINWSDEGVGFTCKKGLKPDSPNQDDFFIMNVDDWEMYGVFDGHGPNGHTVSNFVQNVLPRLLATDPLLWEDTKQCLKNNFVHVHKMLEASGVCDCQVSGCTCTIVITKGNKLFAAHVGDSRAVLAVTDKSQAFGFRAVDLTEDHKPNLEHEKRRILATGGQIRRLEGDIPFRVFVRGKQYPGLAMSRAIGDLIGTQAGVIPEPEVTEMDLEEGQSVFFIACSDGVWEFISSQEAVDMVARKPKSQVQAVAEELSEESWKRWIYEEGNVVDDITVIIKYLNLNTHSKRRPSAASTSSTIIGQKVTGVASESSVSSLEDF